MPRRLYLIAKTIFTEALRRKEIYTIVLLTLFMLGWAGTFRFFNIAGLHKFYQEIALQIMAISTMVTTIVLASRQLPREFASRTIYVTLAKPVSRAEFILGKFLGVVAAGCFCFALFMVVFIGVNLFAGYPMPWGTFLQYVYLQCLLVALVASLAFALSLLFNQDAAITLTGMVYIFGQIFTSAIIIIYDYADAASQMAIRVLNYIVPQTALFDLSSKVIHGFPPISIRIMAILTAYTAAFVILDLGVGYLMFRRRAL